MVTITSMTHQTATTCSSFPCEIHILLRITVLTLKSKHCFWVHGDVHDFCPPSLENSVVNLNTITVQFTYCTRVLIRHKAVYHTNKPTYVTVTWKIKVTFDQYY